MKAMLLLMLLSLVACDEKIADELKGCQASGTCNQIQVRNEAQREEDGLDGANIELRITAHITPTTIQLLDPTHGRVDGPIVLRNGGQCHLDLRGDETFDYVIADDVLTLTSNGESKIFVRDGAGWKWSQSTELVVETLVLELHDRDDPLSDDSVRLQHECATAPAAPTDA